MTRRVAIHPNSRPAMYDAFVDIVRASEAVQVELGEAEVLLWADPAPPDALPECPEIPAMSTWGAAVITLLLLAGGSIVFRYRIGSLSST